MFAHETLQRFPAVSRDLFNKAAAELEAAGYAKGYRQAIKDARREFNAALDHMLRSLDQPEAEEEKAVRTAPEGALTLWQRITQEPIPRPQEKPSGQSHVLNMIALVPGLRGTEIVAALEAANTPVEERTARTALWRLKKLGAIEMRDNRWFPTQRGKEMLEMK